MENDKHRGSLGSRFEGFKATPTEGLWNSIADSLDDKKKRRGFVWWWFGAGMAAVGLISAMTINWNAQPSQMSQENKGDSHQFEMIRTDLEGFKNKQNPTVVESSQFRFSALKKDRLDASLLSNSLNKNNGNNHNSNKPQLDKTIKLDSGELPAITDVFDSWKTRSSELIKGMPIITLNPIEITNFSEPIVALTPSRVKNTKWEIGFGLSYWSKFPKAKSELVTTLETSEPVEPEPLDSTAGLNYDNTPDKIVKTQTVRRSVGAKFHIGYRLGTRLRLTSGLLVETTNYTFASSSDYLDAYLEQEESNIISVNGAYKITSLGIPIGVEYDFLKRKRFSLGTGINILSEIPILETYTPNNVSAFSEKNGPVRNFIAGYDLGFNFNLNASYYLTEKLRIQANPGFRWYAHQGQKYSPLTLPKRKAWFGGSVNLIWRLSN